MNTLLRIQIFNYTNTLVIQLIQLLLNILGNDRLNSAKYTKML